jgi:exosome complex exonuclease RRP6
LLVADHDAFQAMLKTLEGVREVAVSIEEHTVRSYHGLTCLMTLSTRRMDYIVDTLALRREISLLKSLFENNLILKVFHDGWRACAALQRDFDIFVVNMIDTHIAA